MIQHILLIDNGVTVQKIVALSLDKTQFNTFFAVSKEEAKRLIVEKKPALLLVSDRMEGLEWQSFPREVEAWLGRGAVMPRMVLISSGGSQEARHYQGVLKKPFTPQALQELVQTQLTAESALRKNVQNQVSSQGESHMNFDTSSFKSQGSAREKLESLWEDAPKPVAPAETTSRSESVSELWGAAPSASSAQETVRSHHNTDILSTEDSLAYKSLLENQVQQQIETQNLNEMVEKVLSRILPPMVERIIQERLDRLMQEQEKSLQIDL